MSSDENVAESCSVVLQFGWVRVPSRRNCSLACRLCDKAEHVTQSVNFAVKLKEHSDTYFENQECFSHDGLSIASSCEDSHAVSRWLTLFIYKCLYGIHTYEWNHHKPAHPISWVTHRGRSIYQQDCLFYL